MKNSLGLMAVLLTFASCSSSPDVRPGMDGIHQISVRGEEVNDTESDAYKQARAYCRGQKKEVEFLSDETFKATPNELNADPKLFKKTESVATDIRFKCN